MSGFTKKQQRAECHDSLNLSCKKVVFVSQRHDNVRDIFTKLLDKCCTTVESEPHLTELQGETFEHRTANSSSGAKLDIKAMNSWIQGKTRILTYV